MPITDANKPRPNILLIMTDQQRGDCLGCDEKSPAELETPNLDQLAIEGTRFRCAYSAVPSCIPARASLLTGMDQWHTGILGMGRGQGPIPDHYAHTLPGELAAAGYHTQSIGKNHFAPQRALNGYHNCIVDESGRAETPEFVSDYRAWFEQYKDGPYGYRDHSVEWNSWMARPSHLPEHLHPTHWTAQQAIDWLDRRDPAKPFFLKVSFTRPHSPYDPPRWYYDQYLDASIKKPFIGDWAHIHTQPGDGSIGNNPDDVNAWRSSRSHREIERARRAYYASVTFIDHQIGRLRYELRMRYPEAFRNTLIIFLSDHGDMLGDHHLWRKTYAYEGSARVPMIVRLPQTWGHAERGQVRDEVVEMRDVMPTVLDAVGISIPDTVQGRSMLPLMRGQQSQWRSWLHGEHVNCYSEEQAMQYLTDGRWKYIYFPYLGTEQLFDLTDDPGETRNLADDKEHGQTLQTWRNRLVDELTERGSTELVHNGELRPLESGEAYTSPNYKRYGVR